MSVEHKKCPHCGAEIEENARFCLYCMTSLDEKERVMPRLYLRKRWLILSAAFFALLLIGGILLLVLGKSKPEESKEPSDSLPEQQVSQQVPTGNEQAEGEQGGAAVSPQQGEHPSPSENGSGNSGVPSSGGSEQIPPSNQGQGGSSQTQGGSSQTQGGSSQTQSGSSQTQGGSSQTQSGSSQTQGGSSQTQSGSSQTQGGSSQTQSGSSQTQGGSSQTQGGSSQTQGGSSQTQSGSSQTPTEQNPSEDPAPEQEPEQTAPTFTYRQMKYGDDYHTNAAVTDDKIVLTGIQTPAADGIYHIPATIDGKTVIAIEGQAFYNSGHALTVKKIYIPSTLKTIWGSAFVGCYNLTDVYLYGKSIYIDPWAFPALDKRNGTLTIHCSADCSNRDFRYYKNIASSYYDAEYVEWNG